MNNETILTVTKLIVIKTMIISVMMIGDVQQNNKTTKLTALLMTYDEDTDKACGEK